MKWMIGVLACVTLTLGFQQVGAQQAGSPAPAPAPAPALSADDADMIILDRQLVMQQLEKDVDVLGSIFAGAVPAATLVPRLQAIAQGAKESQKSFEAMVPGGGSKPEVWSDRARFNEIMTQFVTKTDEMVKVGQTGDLAAVGVISVDALPCKQCHDLYRVKK